MIKQKITFYMLLFCSSLVAQIYNSQIESNLLHDLNNFALTQKTDTSYHFINTYFFKEILKKVKKKVIIDQKLKKNLLQNIV